MATEGVPEEYVEILQTLIRMNVKPKGENESFRKTRQRRYRHPS